MKAFQVVRDFEKALCDYTGAKYAVTTTSCTMALLLAVAWCKEQHMQRSPFRNPTPPRVTIPKRTYVSVPMSIIHAGCLVGFRDEDWSGGYRLEPFNVWDFARRFTSDMYIAGQMQCVSFHWSKILGIQQGGAILHDDAVADAWLRRARFDGRTEGIAPKDDVFDMIGWHCYMAPETAAQGLVRMSFLPKHNPNLPNDDYPDLSMMRIFR